MITRIAIALVVAVGVVSIAGSIWVARRLAEPTVVRDPYEEGLHYDEHRHGGDARACDLQAGPCSRRVLDTTVTLELAPRPVRGMSEVTFTVGAQRAGRPVADGLAEVSLTMPGMYMGENRVRLAADGPGRYRGRGTLVRCPSGRRTWEARVSVAADAAVAPVTASFTFDTME